MSSRSGTVLAREGKEAAGGWSAGSAQGVRRALSSHRAPMGGWGITGCCCLLAQLALIRAGM